MGKPRANDLLLSSSVTWANSAAANSDRLPSGLPIRIPDPVFAERPRTILTIRNPSAITALTVILYNVEQLAGDYYDAEFVRLSVPANSVQARTILGWCYGFGGKMLLRNDTVLGVADGFTAALAVRLG